MPSDLLKNLNGAQKKAVETSGDCNMLIIAGAGSGKTRVLTHKIAYLISEKKVAPSQVLAMTFSNRAANEMRERIAQLLSFDKVPRWVGTFHSICVRLLREFITDTPLAPDFTIYDEDDQASVIKECLELLNIDDKKYKPRSLVELFSRCKNGIMSEGRYFERETDRINLDNIFTLYSTILKKNNAIDFGGILIEALNLLKRLHIAQKLQSRWKYILIDEYQDTNRVQRELLKCLKSKTNFVCAVGDDDQSIYMWRGATIENILSFPDDFDDCVVIKLEKNYRSTSKILKAANSLISHNSRRMGKELFTDNPQGEEIEYYQAIDEKDEASHIVTRISDLVKTKGARHSDIAVFYRTHAQSRAIEEALVNRGITYRVVGGARFYDRKEIKDIIAYLRFLYNKSDGVSLRRIINLPPRGIGKKTVQMIESSAGAAKATVFELLKRGPYPDQASAKKLAPFVRLINELDSLKEGSLYDLASRIFTLSGYQKMLQDEASFDSETRTDNVKELLNSIKDFESLHQGAGLKEYLETVSLIQDADSYEHANDFVTLMTVHCSKGLEFPYVFIAGLEDGLFPHQNSLDSYDEMEEERRLMYVAITRAMKKLHLSSAFQRRVYATPTYKLPSRFLDEIDESLLSKNRVEGRTSQARDSSRFHRKERSSDHQFVDYIPDYDDADTPYRKGVKIRHPEFGDGVVQRCEKSGDHWRLTINFKYFGLKRIVPGYVDIEIL